MHYVMYSMAKPCLYIYKANYEGVSICNENPFITPSTNADFMPYAKQKIKALPL